MEELLWATQGSLWPVCCGRGTLGYSGITLGQRAVEEVLWATQGSLWPACCGRATLGYSGITLASVLWKSYFGLLRDHFGQCAVEELLWATGRTEVQSSKNLTTPQSYGWRIILVTQYESILQNWYGSAGGREKREKHLPLRCSNVHISASQNNLFFSCWSEPCILCQNYIKIKQSHKV